MTKTLKTIDLAVTTREEMWVKVYSAALAAGFSEEKAKEQTDKTIDEVFRMIGPKREAELREQSNGNRLRSYPVTQQKPDSFSSN